MAGTKTKAPKSKKAKGKAKSGKAKAPKTPKVEKPPAPKKEVKPAARKPPRSDSSGLNLAVARARAVLDTGALNKDVSFALKEIRDAIKDDKSVDDLSEETVQIVEQAKETYLRSQKEEYSRQVVSGMSKSDKKKYQKARKRAKSAFDHAAKNSFTDDGESFDVVKFDEKYSKNFYKDFHPSLPDPGEKTELHVQADLVSKGKIRLGANVKVIFTAFVECLVRQMAVNGTYCCVGGKKMIVNVEHVLDFSKEGIDTRFPLWRFVRGLRAYQEAIDRPDDEEEDNQKGHFNLYVGECFKAARQSMTKKKATLGAVVPKETSAKYARSSISKSLRVFCSNVVVEVLEMISRMLRSELKDKRVKTVTNAMLRTVLQHIHTICGVDYEPTRKFIQEVSAKYVTHVAQRRKEKQAAAPGGAAEEEKSDEDGKAKYQD